MRRGRRPGVLALAIGAAALMAPTAALGTGAEYVVVQCHQLNRGDQAVPVEPGAYNVARWCGDAAHEYSMQVNSENSAGLNVEGAWRWDVPSALGIVGVDLQAKIRRDEGHAARVYVADGARREIFRVASGDQDATPFVRYQARVPRAVHLFTSIVCTRDGGCPQSNLAKAWVRDVKLTVADYSDPGFTLVHGTLLEAGWLRGVHTVAAEASDAGAGLKQIVATANSAQLGASGGSCPYVVGGTSNASRMVPCGVGGELRLGADTRSTPFHDGENALSICAFDFPGNRTCRSYDVRVDNTAPELAFADAQQPQDPEVIRALASDATSGVDRDSGRIWFRAVGEETWIPLSTRFEDGEFRARVDSGAYPAGRYEFVAQASDIAGNESQTTRREDGRPMVLTFPLRAPVELRAHLAPSGSERQTIPYGRDSFVEGRLLTPRGEPIGGQPVTVEEFFGSGALIDRRVRTVRTDARGYWRSKLPAGPSREVRAIYGGSREYRDRRTRAGRLVVRSKATLETSRERVPEGHAVVFEGQVRHLGARIPAGGKLIELQVREGIGHWNTVGEALHTGPGGRYQLRYRFKRFYRSNVAFHFRVKVARESDWPYKAPVGTPVRQVVVVAR
jgi:hypothetical protein